MGVHGGNYIESDSMQCLSAMDDAPRSGRARDIEIWLPSFEDRLELFGQKSIEEISENAQGNLHIERNISVEKRININPDVFRGMPAAQHRS
jgi:hypothetical protein